MPWWRWCSAATLLACLLGSPMPSVVHAQDDILLSDLIRETQIALLRVQEAAEAQGLPPLRDAVLEVQAVATTEGGGGIRLVVVQIGADISTEATSSVRLKLVPPPPGSPTDISPAHMADQLSALILSAAQSLETAKRGNPPLDAEEVTATLRFGISEAGSGRVTLELPQVGVHAGGSGRTSNLQTISVTYGSSR